MISWKKIASIILRNRLIFLISLALSIILMIAIIKVKGVNFSTSNAQLLPSSAPAMLNFDDFNKTFGSESNIIVIGYEDTAMNTPEVFRLWKKTLSKIKSLDGVTGIFDIETSKKLERGKNGFELKPIFNTKLPFHIEKDSLQSFPFYEGIFYNKDNPASQTIIYINPEILNSAERVKETLKINEWIKEFENQTKIDLYVSGMPMIRTMNSKAVKGESFLFIGASLFITCFIFFLFYKSIRATIVAISVVISAVILCFAMLALFGFKITILTALVPPLVVVIGVPNCIYLINKYQKEFELHNNKIKALQRMIIHVGNASMLTNFTTAFGFFTFIFTDSSTLKEFGIVSSLNIIGVFILSFIIVPIAFSYYPSPTKKQLKHLEHNWTNSFLNRLEELVINKRKTVYTSVFVLIILSLLGISQIKSSGNILDDMSKGADFYGDIAFFDKNFGGIIPLEIMIDTKKSHGISSLNTLYKMDSIESFIKKLNVSTKPMSIVDLIKMTKQGYYGNNSEFYKLPTNQERAFILSEIQKNKNAKANLLKNYVDSTGRKARITTMLKNMSSDSLANSISSIKTKLSQVFPSDRFNTYVTGVAYVFQEGTKFLTKNLFISLGIAILIIAMFMAIMFRSTAMIIISLLPNFLPLLTTAGFMGYFDIPIKPSTILVFSIAFGIAVDDTIHFLAKYRQSLHYCKGNIPTALKNSLDNVGESMFYTSIVLFAGFGIFIFSSFNGIVALGGLVSLTLIVAMFSNLVLLPSLLMSYHKLTSDEFINPDYDYFDESEE